MRNICKSFVTLLVIVALALPAICRPAALGGDWQGIIDVNGTKLRLVLHVLEDHGSFKATLDSPDQQANGLAVDSITASGAAVDFDMKIIQAKFNGNLNPKRDAIEGKWSQMGLSLPLTLNRVSGAPKTKVSAKQ